MDISKNLNPSVASLLPSKRPASAQGKEKKVSFSDGISMSIENREQPLAEPGKLPSVMLQKNKAYPPSDIRHYTPPPPLTDQEKRLATFVPFKKLIEEHPELDPQRKKSGFVRPVSWENPEDFSTTGVV